MHALQAPISKSLQTFRLAPRISRSGCVPTRAASPIVNSAAALPKNLIGIHSGVFVGDWKPEDAERAVKGAKDAGFDLIECAHASMGALSIAGLVELENTMFQSITCLKYIASLLCKVWCYAITSQLRLLSRDLLIAGEFGALQSFLRSAIQSTT